MGSVNKGNGMDCKIRRSSDPQSDERDSGLLGAEVLDKGTAKYM